MNTEFITLNSKLIIKNNAIIEEKLKTEEEGFTRFIALVALLSFLFFCIYKIVEEKDYIFIVQLILVLFWLEPHVMRIYRSLFVKTWKSTIRLNEIQRVTSVKLDNGLETEVILQLKSGRKKFIVFRNAENQVEDFITAVDKQENSVVSFN